MATYAVIESGGKQYRVEKGTTLLVDRLPDKEGDTVVLRPVAFRDKQMVLGKDLDKVKVQAKITGHERGEKIRVFKYRAKKGYRKRAGHRSELTRLEVTEIKMGQQAAAKKRTKPGDESPGADGSAKRSSAKKPAAKKPAAKKATEPGDKSPGAGSPAKGSN